MIKPHAQPPGAMKPIASQIAPPWTARKIVPPRGYDGEIIWRPIGIVTPREGSRDAYRAPPPRAPAGSYYAFVVTSKNTLVEGLDEYFKLQAISFRGEIPVVVKL